VVESEIVWLCPVPLLPVKTTSLTTCGDGGTKKSNPLFVVPLGVMRVTCPEVAKGETAAVKLVVVPPVTAAFAVPGLNLTLLFG